MIRQSFLALILVLLVVVGGLVLFMRHGQSPQLGLAGPNILLNEGQRQKLAQADEIFFGGVSLKRAGAQWYLSNGIMADPLLVKTLLGELANMELVRPLTQNADLWAKLGLDSQATPLVIRAGDEDLFRLELGDVAKDGPTGKSGQYVMHAGIVYRMEPPLLVPSKPLQWAALKPELLPKLSDIRVVDVHLVGEAHVSFAVENGRLVVQNLPDQWSVHENQVKRLAQSLSMLDFSGLRPAEGGRLIGRIDLFLNQGSHWVLEVIGYGDARYLAISPPEDHAMADDLQKLWLEFPEQRFDIWSAGRAGFIQAP